MRRRVSAVAVAACAVLAVSVAPASANLRSEYLVLHKKTTARFGYQTVGRNIVHHGMPAKRRDPHGASARPATRREVRLSVERMRRWLAPAPAPQPVASTQTEHTQPSSTSTQGSGSGYQQGSQQATQPVSQAQSSPSYGSSGGGGMQSIAQCESGGNPGAVGGGGQFRGKYQFTYGTWQSVGGSGDPAAAPEAEQDRRAAQLYAREGSSPWPVCGR